MQIFYLTFIYSYTFLIRIASLFNLKARHFIRGYFDGDGCISSAGPSAIRAQVCSATKNVLEVMVDFLEKEFSIPKPNIQKRQAPGKNVIYYFQYSTCATRKFFEQVYYTNCLCLERKLNKFKELVPRNLK